MFIQENFFSVMLDQTCVLLHRGTGAGIPNKQLTHDHIAQISFTQTKLVPLHLERMHCGRLLIIHTCHFGSQIFPECKEGRRRRGEIGIAIMTKKTETEDDMAEFDLVWLSQSLNRLF